MNYDVILTGYKRPQYLKEQFDAVMAQTVKPRDVYIWYNQPAENVKDRIEGLNYIISEKNMKYWSRFTFSAGLDCDFVAIFDDDTIPGTKWIENCFESYKKQPGIYGGNGIRFTRPAYSGSQSEGWKSMNPSISEVDLVGHAWFYKRDIMKYFFMEEPLTRETGEDIFFSYCALKYGGVRTFVPPHPVFDKSMWSSTKGMRYGADKVATYKVRGKWHYDTRNEIVVDYIKRGWKPVFKRQ